MKDIGITGSCDLNNDYCPNIQTPRDQAAVLFLRGKNCQSACGTYLPPSCTRPPNQRFDDVPCPSLYADWIEELANEGITAGCGNNNYCPTAALGSWQMLAWAQKIWPTYSPLPRATTLTYRDEVGRVVTEGQSTTPLDDSSVTISYPKDNIFLGNLLIGSATWSSTTPAWNFYAADHLGTSRLMTDIFAVGAVETHKYWPYGDDGPSTGGDTQKLKFANMERDSEATHYFDHARNHDFRLGRFTSVDRTGGYATNPQTLNRYSYSRDNPLSYVDPNGRQSAPWLFVFTAGGLGLMEGASKGWSYYQAGKPAGEGFAIGLASSLGASAITDISTVVTENPFASGAIYGAADKALESALEEGSLPSVQDLTFAVFTNAFLAKYATLLLPGGVGASPKYFVSRALGGMLRHPNVRTVLERDLLVGALAVGLPLERARASLQNASHALFGEGYLQFMFNLATPSATVATPSGTVTHATVLALACQSRASTRARRTTVNDPTRDAASGRAEPARNVSVVSSGVWVDSHEVRPNSRITANDGGSLSWDADVDSYVCVAPTQSLQEPGWRLSWAYARLGARLARPARVGSMLRSRLASSRGRCVTVYGCAVCCGGCYRPALSF